MRSGLGRYAGGFRYQSQCKQSLSFSKAQFSSASYHNRSIPLGRELCSPSELGRCLRRSFARATVRLRDAQLRVAHVYRYLKVGVHYTIYSGRAGGSQHHAHLSSLRDHNPASSQAEDLSAASTEEQFNRITTRQSILRLSAYEATLGRQGNSDGASPKN